MPFTEVSPWNTTIPDICMRCGGVFMTGRLICDACYERGKGQIHPGWYDLRFVEIMKKLDRDPIQNLVEELDKLEAAK